MAKKAVTWRLSEGLLERLKEAAHRQGVSQASLVEDYVSMGLDGEVARPKPAVVPGVVRGTDILAARQQRLNKQMGWGPK